MRARVRSALPVATAAASVILLAGWLGGAARAQNAPVRHPARAAGSNPPVARAAPLFRAPAGMLHAPMGGKAGAEAEPGPLPSTSAGTGTRSSVDLPELIVLAATGLVVAGASISMRRLRRRGSSRAVTHCYP